MKIKSARPKHISDIARLLTAAFIDDPVLREYVARSRDPETALEGFFTNELKGFYIPRGVVDIAVDDGVILGAGLWSSPDSPMRRRDSIRMLPGMIRSLGRSFPRAVSLSSSAEAATPGFPHWYLYTLVVSPEAQGQGIGGALLDHGIERAGRMPIYLESTTEGSQKLYKRKGFMVLGPVPSSLETPEIGMWRPSQR